jgi:peptide/nickel transport system substrate-binding protein
MKLIQTLIMLISLFFASVLFSAEKINIAISAAPNSMTPFYSTDANSQNINRLIHSSLVDFNYSMQFVCVACETYTEKIQNGKQVVTFKLKPNLSFSDGTKVTAADVKKSFEYFARDEKIKSTFIGTFEPIEKVNVIDERTVEFIYSTFSLENISNLSLLKIVKLKKNANKVALEPTDIIGCGDYFLKEILPLEIIIEPRKIGRSILDFKVVKDETTLALKIINKEIDLSVANMSPRKIFWMKSQPGIKIWNIPSANYQFMGLNHKRDIFKDLKVRKAISLLIPREEILQFKLKNTAVLSNGLFSPAFGEMYEKGNVEKYNVEAARKLLAEAGWKKNKNGILEKGGKPLTIDWKVSNNKASIEVVEVLQHFFEKEGMIVNVSVQEWGTYMASFKAGKFDIVIGQWVGFSGPDILKYVFHSLSIPPKGGNRIGYNNPALDAVLDQATVESDPRKRTALYKHALQMVNSDYAYINLWHPNIIWVGRDCLSDIKLESSGSFYPLRTLEKNCGK